jgi:phenylacetate-CoA ligase
MKMPKTTGVAAALYNRVPPIVRDWIASRYGARNMKLRYGGSFARHLSEFRERDTWPLEKLVEWRDARLRELLALAVRQVPHYRRLHAQGAFPVEDVRTASDLDRLPILEKETVRRHPTEFLATDPGSLSVLYTSGTTGTPVKLFRSIETIRTWYACFECRARGWAGVRQGDRFAALGGQLVVPFERNRPPFWVWNEPGQQLYMSVYHLSPTFLDAYLDEIVRRRVCYLYGYASALDALAAHALERKRRDIRLKVAISNAEPLFEHQRERLRAAFGCEVRDTYAPSELTLGAFECEAGRMHLAMEMGVVESVDARDRPCPVGASGEFICTGLMNFDQVLIRYRQGDRGALLSSTDPCRCGRKAPGLATIDGRQDDVLLTADGRSVGRLDPVFKGGMSIREAQIVQLRLDEIEVRVVPADGYSDRDARAIADRLRERMGNIAVRVVEVDKLERTATGKLRAVLSLINPNEVPRDRARP